MSTDPARARAGGIRVNPDQDPSTNRSRSFLPTIYANLDPASIPTAYAEKDYNATRAIVALAALERAFRLGIVSRKNIHGLWPSVWAWLEWLYTHWVDASASVLTVWASLLAWFRKHSKTRTLARRTPGAQIVAAGAWAALVRSDEVEFAHILRHQESGVHRFMQFLDPSQDFESFVAASGGNLEATAGLLVRQFTHSILGPQIRRTALFLYHALQLFPIQNPRLDEILISRGIIEAMIKTILALDRHAASSDECVSSTQLLCATRLYGTLMNRHVNRRVLQALETGYLRALIVCGEIEVPDARIILAGLWAFLLGSMVNHSVVSAIKPFFLEAFPRATTPSFAASPSATEWVALMYLVQDRGRMLEECGRGVYPALKMCDNMNCDTGIRPKASFRRCGSCEKAYYCSKECQLTDWREGHRAACASVRASTLSGAKGTIWDPLRTIDKSFMRALIHRDYRVDLKEEILAHQIVFMKRNPGRAFFTLFDYTMGIPILRVMLYPDGGAAPEWNVVWRDYKLRAERSGGKMDIHMMMITDGVARWRGIVFPLRARNSVMDEGRRKIARKDIIPADPDAPRLRMAVRALMSINVEEIH